MDAGETDFWTDRTSVLFTSFWGWTPESWGTVGFTGDRGASRRTNLLARLTDPFITVGYATNTTDSADAELKGKVCGFFLTSHETGDRDEFTHPKHHALAPDKWRHSLRAIRAFSYLPEYRLNVRDFDASLLRAAQSVGAMGKVLKHPDQIATLRATPWREVECYSPPRGGLDAESAATDEGSVRAGPSRTRGYAVSAGLQHLERELYILRLHGDTDAYIGSSADGRSIYKVGLSVSPELRRQDFQRALPRGAFTWRVHRASKRCGLATCASFEAAVAGEDAMKRHLVTCATWLGGEFYLAHDAAIERAWALGHAAAESFGRTR